MNTSEVARLREQIELCQHSYTRTHIYGMLLLKYKESTFQSVQRREVSP